MISRLPVLSSQIISDDLRLLALLQLANEGIEEAVADLWHEYGLVFDNDVASTVTEADDLAA